MNWLYVLFFVSGFPALIYQIVWQRALFAIYGINIESVTIVVSAFMLGLGIGSLVGGVVSKRPGVPLLATFGAIELSIALFGVYSLRLFQEVGIHTARAPLMIVGLLTFGLVVLPTMLMGATLPILVAHLVRVSGNVGNSVGSLYAVNTLGSAVACLLSARFLMRLLGESGSVYLAASLNCAVALSALAVFFLRRGRHLPQSPAREQALASAPRTSIPVLFPWALVAAAICGFIALSYEIVWYRVYSFASGSNARVFALLLAAYLEGIAAGSFFSRPVCQAVSARKGSFGRAAIATLAVGASAAGFFVVPLTAFGLRSLNLIVMLPLVGIATCLLGGLFPLICHASIPPDERAGARLSYLYLSNIAGSVAGTLLVGFVLMDFWSLRQISVFLASLGVLLGLGFIATTLHGAQLAGAAVAGVGLVATFGLCAQPLFEHSYERMLFKVDYRPDARDQQFAHLIESKSGVIAVSPDGTVFGGGIYDGRFNTSPLRDTNWIIRAYAISSFHANPRNVLMVGLSSGSWAQVIANHPQVEKLTIVEINPTYTELIPQYPQVASLLHNPKVHIVTDDGRRWMVRNPLAKFDLIVMNTSFNWREHVTNLLSSDFLRLARAHLERGGVLYYNTTESGEVQRTGATVFPYALMVVNFLAVSDSPIVVDKSRWRTMLAGYQIDGKPVFDFSRPQDARRFEEMLSLADTLDGKPHKGPLIMEYAPAILARTRNARLITDDNMGTEWAEAE
ncbi:MAG TPA: fused MFS/spermidine synthase [Bryobacteraceae bacterium]|nr:fused MFS/spermidine synthase [Bryobacteraceae bacterium]